MFMEDQDHLSPLTFTLIFTLKYHNFHDTAVAINLEVQQGNIQISLNALLKFPPCPPALQFLQSPDL